MFFKNSVIHNTEVELIGDCSRYELDFLVNMSIANSDWEQFYVLLPLKEVVPLVHSVFFLCEYAGIKVVSQEYPKGNKKDMVYIKFSIHKTDSEHIKVEISYIPLFDIDNGGFYFCSDSDIIASSEITYSVFDALARVNNRISVFRLCNRKDKQIKISCVE